MERCCASNRGPTSGIYTTGRSNQMSERRGNQRVPVILDVVLNYREHALICTMRDISLEGAFVEAPPEELPFANSSVEIAMTVMRGGESKHCRLPARIRRVSDDGAAISFRDLERDAYSNLVSIVYEA
jgi:hypothetical protein